MKPTVALLVLAAASAPVRLSYERGAGAEACVDEAGLREAVEARLGWVPWDDAAKETIAVRMRRGAGGFEATVARLEPGKGEVGSRTLAAPSCEELSASVALAIAIAVDPLGKGPPPPPPATAAPAAASSDGVLVVSLGAGLSGVVGAGPAPTVSARAIVEGRAGRGSLAVEGRADLPSHEAVAGGSVSAGVVAGSLVPCLHAGALSGCAVGTFGVLRASGEGFADAARVDAPYVAAGVRLGWTIPITERVAARAGGELLAHLARTTLVDSATRETRFELPPFSAGGGASILAAFP